MPPLAPLVALLLSTGIVLAMFPLAAHDRSGPTSISPFSVGGWLVGTWLALGLFVWFRAANDGRAGRPNYVIPRWRPAWVVGLLVGASLSGAVFHVWIIADAWSRR
jgi:hypothetical protein